MHKEGTINKLNIFKTKNIHLFKTYQTNFFSTSGSFDGFLGNSLMLNQPYKILINFENN